MALRLSLLRSNKESVSDVTDAARIRIKVSPERPFGFTRIVTSGILPSHLEQGYWGTARTTLTLRFEFKSRFADLL